MSDFSDLTNAYRLGSPRCGRGVRAGAALLLSALLIAPDVGLAESPPPASKPRVVAALENITNLNRPGQDGFATIWDGNKYVQCSRLQDRSFRCEAAGTLMQPSLQQVLLPGRVARLAELGWRLEPSFGNYVQMFPPDAPADQIADKLLRALGEGYHADLAHLGVKSAWVVSEPCPPRNGPGQNLAGSVNDAPAMAATAVYACAYTPAPAAGPNRPVASTGELIGFYGARVTGEIQRLRVNIDRRAYAILRTGIGYIQCSTRSSPPAIYCEAQSAESWPALASVLTPDRVGRLHDAGYAEPGRAPNYWKIYPIDEVEDATIAHEVLAILHEVYGYTGLPELNVRTEEVHR